MPEILLHYIWQRGIFLAFPQATTDGQPVQVLSVGQHNTDSGPDFTNVHLRIGDITLVGNVEMHIFSSDWYHHRHHTDRAYDNIILHVVRKADKLIFNTRGDAIPQMELQYPDEQDYLKQLTEDAHLMDTAFGTHRCAKHLIDHPSWLTDGWKRTMLFKRLECKRQSITQLLGILKNDCAQAMYITLAHHFGFHVNGVPAERMAIQTPLSVLHKHRNSLFQMTAILLGQSGLLDAGQCANNDKQEEWSVLRKEYAFLKHKYNLEPIDGTLWKHGRLRPQNAPEVRVRQLAQLLYQTEFMYSRAMACQSVAAMRELLTLQPVEENALLHIAPAPPIGKDAIDSLIINVIVPYLYAAGKREHALAILESLPAEKNSIIRQWQTLGQLVRNAADSQALIHLYQTCCQSGQCINCDVAYQIFLDHHSYPTNHQ